MFFEINLSYLYRKEMFRMFYIDKDNNMHLSRGDEMNFDVKLKDKESGQFYTFQVGDELVFTVAKNLRERYEIQVVKYITEPTETVNFLIDSTLFGNETITTQEFEFDVVLNGKFSVICNDIFGKKKLFLYARTYKRGDLNE